MKHLIFLLNLIPILTYGQTETQRFISVRGESEINIVPDRIELTITYSETENIKKDNELRHKETELIKLLRSFSIDLEKLTIDNFAGNRYGYYKSYSNKVRFSKVFKLQLDDIEVVDSLILKIFETGANNVAVTNLQSDKLEQTYLEATKLALDKATQKAEIMVSHLNCSIGKVIEVSEYKPKFHTSNEDEAFYLRSKSSTGFGIDRMISSEGENIGIRNIQVRYIVDVKYEIQ